MLDTRINSYITLYSWAHMVKDLRLMAYAVTLLNWILMYPPLVFFELNTVILLHLTYPLWERWAVRRFVSSPSERTRKQLAFVQKHCPRKARVQCLP